MVVAGTFAIHEALARFAARLLKKVRAKLIQVRIAGALIHEQLVAARLGATRLIDNDQIGEWLPQPAGD